MTPPSVAQARAVVRHILILTDTCPTLGPNGVLGTAVAEDGKVLAGHVSTNASWAVHDMGLTSDWQHDKYREHYPDGYELVNLIGKSPSACRTDPTYGALYAAAVEANARASREAPAPREGEG